MSKYSPIIFNNIFNMIIIAIIIILCLIIVILKQHQHNVHIDTEVQNKLYETQKEINNLFNQKSTLLQDIAEQKQKAEEIYKKEKNKISEEIEIHKKEADHAVEQYVNILEQNYTKIEKEYDNKISLLEAQEQQKKDTIANFNNQIDKLQSTLDAGARAQLREQQKEQQLNFYKLSLTQTDLDDILKLENVKTLLHNPIVLNKLIWTTYFQKQTVELCNRVLGTTDKVCGIYKITDLKTQQYYIGQSVDISRRLQEHIKCGLGIDTLSSNKLYQAMQKDGIWNFTFEVLEQCPREQLDEKEKFWINMYHAADYGMNSTKGNK